MAADITACCRSIADAIRTETARAIGDAEKAIAAEIQPALDIIDLPGAHTTIRGMSFATFGNLQNVAGSYGRGFGKFYLGGTGDGTVAYSIYGIRAGDRVSLNGATLAAGRDYTIGTNTLTLAYALVRGDLLTIKSWRA